MCNTDEQDDRRRRWPGVLVSLLWALGLALWTVSLLTPEPVQFGKEVLPPEATFPVAKATHIAVYAALTAALAWLTLPLAGRWALVLLLALHGGATEYLQQFVEGRTGTFMDVGFDLLGIVLGLAISRAWDWRRGRQGPSSPGCSAPPVAPAPGPPA